MVWRSLRKLIPYFVRTASVGTKLTRSQHFCSGLVKNNIMNGKDKFTVAVEGNIGSGKTFLLEYFSNKPGIQVFLEPVERWRDVNGHNLLDLMYRAPDRWSLTFQTHVQLTMLDIHKRPHADGQRLKMMERSIFSAKYCFVENLHRSGNMPDAEYSVLSEWFNWIVKEQNIQLDQIVYLQTRPETVFKRINNRARNEERQIALSYLETLHQLHEDWLIHQTFPLPAPVLVLDANCQLEEMKQTFEKYSESILMQSMSAK